MATEYKLPYTASEIDEKLSKIDSLAEKSELPTKTSQLENDSGYITANDVPQPLVGLSTEIKPSQVYTAVLSGIPVTIEHTDSLYGKMFFNYFAYSDAASNSFVSNTVFEMNDYVFSAQLIGDLTSDVWGFQVTHLSKASDIPTTTSQLTNDSGFLTAAPVTSVNGQTGAVQIAIPTVSDALPNPNTLTINGVAYDGNETVEVEVAKKENAVYYIVGDSTTAGTWTGTSDDITEYYDGLMIAYKTNIAGISGGTTLNINNLGAVAIVRNTTSAITTHYGVGSILMLTYTVDIASDGTTTNYWKLADYDSDTKTRSSNKTATKMYIIGATTQSTSGQTTYSNKNCYIGTDNCLYSGGAKVATTSDTLANPNVLTIDSTTYDGSAAVDMTSAINALIDAKLAEITNAEEVSF